MPLHPDVLLGIHLSTIISRDRYTKDPGPVIARLRAEGGDRLDVLLPEVGRWVGFYDDEYVHTLAVALMDAFPDAEPWVKVGRERRLKPVHSTDDYR